MNVIRAPRFLLLCSLVGLAVFAGPPPAAIAAGKASIDLTIVSVGPVAKGTKQNLEAHITAGAGGRKVAFHERDKSSSNDPSRRAVPVNEGGAKVEHFILFVTALDKNGDHEADHYDLKLDEDSDGDGAANEGPDLYKDGSDDEAGLLADVDAMERKLVALLVSRGE